MSIFIFFKAERRFAKSQEDRREIQRRIVLLQQRMDELHAELERIPRGDDKYLALVTQEHACIKDNKRLCAEFEQFEKEERDNFSGLSNAVRDSHEKERTQAEKTKYWSIIGSVLGTVLGIIGSNINGNLHMKELRQLVRDAASASEAKTPEQLLHLLPVPADMKSETEFGEKERKRLQDLVEELVVELRKKPTEQHLPNLDVGDRLVIFPEHQMETLLDNQQQHLTKIIVASSIAIPICTWFLQKLFYM